MVNLEIWQRILDKEKMEEENLIRQTKRRPKMTDEEKKEKLHLKKRQKQKRKQKTIQRRRKYGNAKN